MIYFGFNITNPWSRRFENVWNNVYEVFSHSKYIELDVYKDNTIVSFSFRLTTRQDHAGLMIDAGLLGYTVSFQYYDIRHWNHEAGRYYKYSEELGEH